MEDQPEQEQPDNNEEELEFELVYPLSSEELFNNMTACITAYDFLDRTKDDIVVIQSSLGSKINDAMVQCIETLCALVEELHENTVIQDEGE